MSLDPYDYPIREGSFDLVISGSTMEHVAKPWLWVPELVRVVRPGGMLAIVTHWCYEEHGEPALGFLDYWRVMPDGLRLLLEETGELE
ncbi:MAG: class I SAM-dependent methyltransferase, partial [Akkermansiaceae bacterium]|nr:class I SAM-dependent methyltransferase [Akkermansiaceae bacterium]